MSRYFLEFSEFYFPEVVAMPPPGLGPVAAPNIPPCAMPKYTTHPCTCYIMGHCTGQRWLYAMEQATMRLPCNNTAQIEPPPLRSPNSQIWQISVVSKTLSVVLLPMIFVAHRPPRCPHPGHRHVRRRRPHLAPILRPWPTTHCLPRISHHYARPSP